jgi:hypothetical protein
MLKLTVAVLALALAGTASAAGWRSLRIDASSEASFTESVAALQEKLSKARGYVFALALQDIWMRGREDATAAQREYTASDYFRQVDGLGYDEIVTLTDPTGDRTQMRYKAAKQMALQNRYASFRPANTSGSSGTADRAPPPTGWSGQQVRGATQTDMLPCQFCR